MRQALLLAVILATSVSAQPADLRTRAETSNYEETSTYDDVMRLAKALAAGSASTHYESYGRTEEGREMPLLVLSEPAVATPEAARKLARPIVFIQGNIHAGEVEGKEAALIIARRLTQGDLRPMLKQLVVLIAPIYNADGNEKFSLQNRTAQYGPIAGVGTRENSKGLDLNRDHMKLDSAEARAFVGLLNRWDPHVGIDLHTTNGSYHGYHLTYSPSLNPNADARLIALARERILPAMADGGAEEAQFPDLLLRQLRLGIGQAGPSRVDPSNPGDTTWRTFDHRPRFNNNYLGLRNRLAILSEAYSYADFGTRVRVTEVFVEEALNAVVANGKQIMTLTAQLDNETKSYASDHSEAAQPRGRLPPCGVARAGGHPGRRRREEGQPALQSRNAGDGRQGHARQDEGLRHLRGHTQRVDAARLAHAAPPCRIQTPTPSPSSVFELHGVQVQRVVADAEVMVERFVIDTYSRSPKPFQNRYEARLNGKLESAKLSAQEGALFIPANQPLARLAFYLLEPESDDGFVTWNLIEAGLSPGATYPIYRVTGGVLKTQ